MWDRTNLGSMREYRGREWEVWGDGGLDSTFFPYFISLQFLLTSDLSPPNSFTKNPYLYRYLRG